MKYRVLIFLFVLIISGLQPVSAQVHYRVGLNTSFEMGWLFYRKGDGRGYDRSHLRPTVPVEMDATVGVKKLEIGLSGGMAFFYDNLIISSTDRVGDRNRYALSSKKGYTLRTYHIALQAGYEVAGNEKFRVVPWVGLGTFKTDTRFPYSEDFQKQILRRFGVRVELFRSHPWRFYFSPMYDFYTIDSKKFTYNNEGIELHGLGIGFGISKYWNTSKRSGKK